MLKKSITILCFIISSSLVFANEWDFTTELFSLETEGTLEENSRWGVNLGLPTLHFINNYYNLNLNLEIGEVKTNEYSYSDLSLGKLGIMYNFYGEENGFIGPFVNLGLKSVQNPSMEYNVGVKMNFFLPMEFFEPIPVTLRLVNTEIGYSIDENRFFFNISADPVIAAVVIGYMFGAGEYKDATGEEYDPDEIQKDDPFREDFK